MTSIWPVQGQAYMAHCSHMQLGVSLPSYLFAALRPAAPVMLVSLLLSSSLSHDVYQVLLRNPTTWFQISAKVLPTAVRGAVAQTSAPLLCHQQRSMQ